MTKRSLQRSIPPFVFLALAILSIVGCRGNKSSGEEIPETDTIVAVTLYGPTSYFTYRGEELGFDYENLKEFAKENNLPFRLTVASSMANMIEMLQNGEADLAAFPIPYIEEYKSLIDHCGPREVTWQVLVQKKGKEKITDVTQLIGRQVYVEKDSRYHFRMLNLNEELGGGIDIVAIDRDSISSEDLMDMVENDEIPLTVIDSDIAAINSPYYPGLDTSLHVSLEQSASWAVAKGNVKLKKLFEQWDSEINESSTLKNIYRKYFEYSKDSTQWAPISDIENFKGQGSGKISAYDYLFKTYGKKYDIDWRLLAAIGYNESRFNPTAESRFGAKGLMQIMDVAAIASGESPERLFEPEVNIHTAAKTFRLLDKALKSQVADSAERVKFILASYNSGLGHIKDAIALAEKHGLNPEKWSGSVSEAALLKSRPEYYNDPVVKNGYFRGKETVNFVDKVLVTYSKFLAFTE